VVVVKDNFVTGKQCIRSYGYDIDTCHNCLNAISLPVLQTPFLTKHTLHHLHQTSFICHEGHKTYYVCHAYQTHVWQSFSVLISIKKSQQ
jgi:hypothetical protein